MATSEGVMATNDDASQCKNFAVTVGYWSDPYIKHFIGSKPVRKAPEINRGYYIRNRTMNVLVRQFLNRTNSNCQIVNLGAGFDTMFWNLYKENLFPKHGFYEVDLVTVVKRKINCIRSASQLNCVFAQSTMTESEFGLHTNIYHLLSADLQDVASLTKGLLSAGIQYNCPTLFLAECVLVYLDPGNIKNLFGYISKTFSNVTLLDYDPISLSDRFGEIMREHLRQRNCTLSCVFSDIRSKNEFYSEHFNTVQTELLRTVYERLPNGERKRAEGLEFFDELDLLWDLLNHYSVSLSWNGNAYFNSLGAL